MQRARAADPPACCGEALAERVRKARVDRETPKEPTMIYVTQLIYVHEGHEAAFEQFEAIVLPRLAMYSGELVLRLRPDAGSKIGGTAELPYEVHLVRFETDEDLARYAQDEERMRWIELKDRSVRSSLVIKGGTPPTMPR
jgi:hypothetical protein